MPRLIDLTGREFGRLRVIERGDTTDSTGPDGRAVTPRVLWWCHCAPDLGGCGAEKQIDGAHLRKGAVVSCGCYRREWAAGRAVLPGRPGNKLVADGPVTVTRVCRQCGHEFDGAAYQVCCSRPCTRAYRTAYERRRLKGDAS